MSESFENQRDFCFARGGLSPSSTPIPSSGAPHACARVKSAAATTTITGHVNPQITKPCSAACSSASPFHPVASTLARPRALGLAMAAAAAPTGEHARRRCCYGFRIHLRHASDQDFLRRFGELHPPLLGSIPHPEFIPMRPAPNTELSVALCRDGSVVNASPLSSSDI